MFGREETGKHCKKSSWCKRGIMVLFFILVFLISLPAYAIHYVDENNKKVEIDDFLDTKGHWAQELLRVWADYDIVKGGTDGKFRPNDYITRADIGVILDKLFALKQGALNNFRDLNNNQYYTESLLRSYAAGFITGVDIDRLAPTAYATREQVASMLVRAFKIEGGNTSTTFFKDDRDISYWARSSVNALVRNGYMAGVGEGILKPKRNITRAELMAMIDKLITSYYSGVGKQAGVSRYSNNYIGNGFVGKNGVEIFRSDITGNLYLNNNGSSGFKLVDSVVRGSIFVLGDRGDINISGSTVDELNVYGKSSIKGVDGVKYVRLYRFSSGSTLDSIPKELILEPGVQVVINNVKYENNSSGVRTYIGDDIKKDIAHEKGFVDGGPKVSFKECNINFNNAVIFKGCKLETTGDSDIKELGVVYSRGKGVPSIEDYSGRGVYSGDVEEEFDIDLWKQYKSSEYTYRMYAINKNNLVGYSKAVTLESYDFDIEMKVFQVAGGVRAEVHILGSKIPAIQRINCTHGLSSIYEEVKEYRAMTEDKSVTNSSVKGDEKRRYVVELKFSGTTPVSTYYGYDITFSSAGEINEFPVLRNPSIINIKPVEMMETGHAVFSGSYYMDVRDNKLETNFVEIQSVGVVKKEVFEGELVGTPTAGESGWVEYSASIRPEDKKSYVFDVYADILNRNKTVYYALYVKTATGYYYGDVKSIAPYYSGSLSNPVITHKPEVTVFSSDTAMVDIHYDAVSDIDIRILGSIFSFRDSQNKAVLPYDGGALRDAQVYVNKGEKKLSLVFKGLSKNERYTCKLRLFDKPGVSGMETIIIDTRDVIPITLSLKEIGSLGENISYYINYGGYALATSKVTVDGVESGVWFDKIADKPYFKFKAVDTNVEVEITFKYYISTLIDEIRYVQFNRVFAISSVF